MRREEGSVAARRSGPLRVLFLCSRNRRRSPTAEAVFGAMDGVETASAGLATDADEVVTPDHLEWAEMIFVMERRHHAILQRRFGPYIRHARVVCLDIPDDYDFMDPALLARLERRVTPLLRVRR